MGTRMLIQNLWLVCTLRTRELLAPRLVDVTIILTFVILCSEKVVPFGSETVEVTPAGHFKKSHLK